MQRDQPKRRQMAAWLLAAFLLWPAMSVVVDAQSSDRVKPELPTLFIIGDSTVNNSSNDFVGWGNLVHEYFDLSRIRVVNRARGGRSSRTFQTEGLWDQVLNEMKPGDYVLIQFGHNDGGPIDTERARGSLKGVGEETRDIVIAATGKAETVHTFGWYMRKYARDARSKGVLPLVLSPVPRNVWKEGKVVRAAGDYGKWAREAAVAAGAAFVDLNDLIADRYDREGPEKVREYFTDKDHTHTSAAGARANAISVAQGLQSTPLKKLLAKR